MKNNLKKHEIKLQKCMGINGGSIPKNMFFKKINIFEILFFRCFWSETCLGKLKKSIWWLRIVDFIIRFATVHRLSPYDFTEASSCLVYCQRWYFWISFQPILGVFGLVFGLVARPLCILHCSYFVFYFFYCYVNFAYFQ